MRPHAPSESVLRTLDRPPRTQHLCMAWRMRSEMSSGSERRKGSARQKGSGSPYSFLPSQ